MIIHPSVFRLSKRLGLFMPFAGLFAALTYLTSLSGGVVPGYSATLVAGAAGVIPSSRAAHPLFSLISRCVAGLEIFSLPVRLNLFSAFCGIICAMLLFYLVGRMILFSVCEDGGGEENTGIMLDAGDDDGNAFNLLPDLPPAVEAFNRNVFKLAVGGGMIAAVLFIFSVPVWSASTRLDNGSFTLLLALVSFSIFPFCNARFQNVRLGVSTFFYVIGLFESGAFVLFLPFYTFFLFRSWFFYSSRRAVAGFWIVLAGLLGTICVVLAFRENTSEAQTFTIFHVLHVYAKELCGHHFFEVRSFFPRIGWLFVILQVALPAGIMLFGHNVLYKEKKAGIVAAMLLLTLSVIPALLNLSISPFGIYYKSIGRMPIISSAIIAVAVAMVLSACFHHISKEGRSENADQDMDFAEEVEGVFGFRKYVGLLFIVLSLVCVVSFWRSWCAVDSKQGGFADEVAREVLVAMKNRTCLVTNGLLDNHLKIQARILKKPVNFITLRPRPMLHEIEAVSKMIIESPVFEGLNRIRLQNALSISPVRFVMEWFNTDTRAADKAMLFATPDIWTACGYQAVPEGMAFGGVKSGDKPDTMLLVKQNREFVERVKPWVSDQSRNEGAGMSWLRKMLQMKAGFAANELGILLEEQEELDQAYQAYMRAVALDPVNVSATVNAYVLVQTKGLHPEAEDKLKKRMKQTVENANVRSFQNVSWILQNHGTIRQEKFYRQQKESWSSMGARMVAADKIRKAHSLVERTEVAALVNNASLYLQSGNIAKAESCYLAVLNNDSGNREALLGLCTMMLGQKKIQNAEKWYQRALDAGVEPSALRYQTIMLAILKKNNEQALKLLKVATKEVPSDARYWVLLADLLLSRGDIQYVERQMLPDMQQALKTTDHCMIHAVRGMALQLDGPSYYKKARLSYLKALSLNADLPDIWNALLKLDMRLGIDEFTETDALSLLKLNPDHSLANYLLGASLLKRNKLQESEDFLRRSIENRSTVAACNDLAENLRLQKNLVDAEAFARQALEMEPKLLPALDTLASVLADAGKYNEAAKTVDQALKIKNDYTPAQLTLLRTKVLQGDRAGVYQRLVVLEELNIDVPETLQKEIKALK